MKTLLLLLCGILVACDKPVTLEGAKAEAHSGQITYELADEKVKK